MMLAKCLDARRRIVCDELALCPADDGAWAVVDAMGELWVPMPGRPGFVSRRDVPFSPAYVDALRSAMRLAPLSSSVWVAMPAGVYECLGGFAGCSLRGRGDGDE